MHYLLKISLRYTHRLSFSSTSNLMKRDTGYSVLMDSSRPISGPTACANWDNRYDYNHKLTRACLEATERERVERCVCALDAHPIRLLKIDKLASIIPFVRVFLQSIFFQSRSNLVEQIQLVSSSRHRCLHEHRVALSASKRLQQLG